jgi:hypothetical protein
MDPSATIRRDDGVVVSRERLLVESRIAVEDGTTDTIAVGLPSSFAFGLFGVGWTIW